MMTKGEKKRESSNMDNSTDKVRREALFIVYYLYSSFLLSNNIIHLKARSSMLMEG
jgi:hypothetical protein